MTSYQHDWPWSLFKVRKTLLRLGLLLDQQYPCNLPALDGICVTRSQPYRRAVDMLLRFAPWLLNGDRPWPEPNSIGCWVAAQGPFEDIEATVRASCLKLGMQVLHVTRHDEAPGPVSSDNIDTAADTFDVMQPIQQMHSDRLSLHEVMAVLGDLKQLIDDHGLTDIIVRGCREPLRERSAYVNASNMLIEYQRQVVQGFQRVSDVALVGFWLTRLAEPTEGLPEGADLFRSVLLAGRECGLEPLQITMPYLYGLGGRKLDSGERSEVLNHLPKGGLS